MATVCEHLSVKELEERYVGWQNATASRHFQAIWLLARGRTIAQAAATTAYGERWIEQLLASPLSGFPFLASRGKPSSKGLARYNAEGPEALGDLRRRNGASATILKPGLLDKLRLRLGEPPPDGGLWSSRKVAAFMAGELGLASVAPQRGWRAESRVAGQSEAIRASGLSGAAKARQALKTIGWSIQKPRPSPGFLLSLRAKSGRAKGSPRPKNPKSAAPPPAIPSRFARRNLWLAPPEEVAAFKKSSRTPLPKRQRSIKASRSRSSPRTSIALA